MAIDLKIVSQRLRQTWLTRPYKAGVIMVAFTKDRFKYQNWLDAYPEPWKPRKAETKWGKTKRNNGRALLVDRGRLLRGNRIISSTMNSVTIGNDAPYASAHNDGVRLGIIQEVGEHTRKRYKLQKVGTGIYSIKTRKERFKTKKVETGEIVVKAHQRRINQNIPRRRFMGESRFLSNQINRMIEAEILKTFR